MACCWYFSPPRGISSRTYLRLSAEQICSTQLSQLLRQSPQLRVNIVQICWFPWNWLNAARCVGFYCVSFFNPFPIKARDGNALHQEGKKSALAWPSSVYKCVGPNLSQKTYAVDANFYHKDLERSWCAGDVCFAEEGQKWAELVTRTQLLITRQA